MGVGSSRAGGNGGGSVEAAEFDFRNSVKRRDLEEVLAETEKKLAHRPAFADNAATTADGCRKHEADEDAAEDIDSGHPPRRRKSSVIGGWLDEIKRKTSGAGGRGFDGSGSKFGNNNGSAAGDNGGYDSGYCGSSNGYNGGSGEEDVQGR